MPEKPSYGYYGFFLLLTLPAFVLLFWRTRGGRPERKAGAPACSPRPWGPASLPCSCKSPSRHWSRRTSTGLDVGWPEGRADARRSSSPACSPCPSPPPTPSWSTTCSTSGCIARKALQYALARYSAIAPRRGAAGGHHASMSSATGSSDRGDLLRRPHLLLLGAVARWWALGALRYRRTLLDSIDRHFFREQYDARQTLTLLVERIRATHGVADLANLLCREVGPRPPSRERVADGLRARAPGCSPIPRSAAGGSTPPRQLAALIASASDPLPVDLEDSRSPLAKLPEKDRHWLVDSGFRLIVPILARDGSLLGLIGLGEKKSGLPFFKEDRQLLRAIASSAAWVLELELEPLARLLLGAGQDPVEGSRLAAPRGGRPAPSSPRSAPTAAGSTPPTPSSAPRAAGGWSPRTSPTCCPASSASSGGSAPAAWAWSTAAPTSRSAGRWRSRPCGGSPPRTPCGCGARRARRRRSPTPTSLRSTAWRPGRGRRCW